MQPISRSPRRAIFFSSVRIHRAQTLNILMKYSTNQLFKRNETLERLGKDNRQPLNHIENWRKNFSLQLIEWLDKNGLSP